MGKSNAFENAVLELFFKATSIADLAENDSSSPATDLYISLHTADPGEAGDQTTNEATYTGYARKAVVRTGTGWTVTGNQASNAAAIVFDPCTAGTNVIGWFGIGKASAGAGLLMWKAALATVNQGPFTATTADVFTVPGHSLANDEKVVFYPSNGSALPTGITEGTIYYVIGVSGDTFSVSATQGGAAVNITAAGDGVCFEIKTLSVSDGISPQFAIGALVVTED